MTPQHFQNEQLGSQGLLWAALTLKLFPTPHSQGLLASTQATYPTLMLGLEAACLPEALPCLALPQKSDHDFCQM